MSQENIVVGDIEYQPYYSKVVPAKYVGNGGANDTLTIPDKIVTPEQKEREVVLNTCRWMNVVTMDFENLNVGHIVINAECTDYHVFPYNCPNLQDMVLKKKATVGDIRRCPKLEKIVFENGMHIDEWGAQFKGRFTLDVSGEVTIKKTVDMPSATMRFLDQETVPLICNGHIWLNEGVKAIALIKKPELLEDTTLAPDTVAPYYLPLRIDFNSVEPPLVAHVEPASIGRAELHVPKGAVEAYAKHAQWSKAAYITDDAGTVVDNYAKKFKKLAADKEKKAVKEAKAEKLETLQNMQHSVIGQTRLAKWPDAVIKEQEPSKTFTVDITIKGLPLTFEFDSNKPITIWDEIVAEIERVESII